jgi:hypothetical protein
MTAFKKKFTILAALAGLLAVIYALTFVFSQEKRANRGLSYTWLDGKLVDQADSLEVRGSETHALTRKGGVWTLAVEGAEYPVKQSKVGDLFTALTRPGAYGVRSSAESSYGRLGVTDGAAARITVKGGAAGNALLELLVGNKDATGKEVHLRNSALKDVRSGEDRFTAYTGASRISWLDTRLFPDHDAAGLTAESVQRVRVAPPLAAAKEGETLPIPEPPFTLQRTRNGWELTEGALPAKAAAPNDGTDNANAAPELDKSKVDTYIRAILDAEGDDFAYSKKSADSEFAPGNSAAGTITLDFAGSTRTITVAADEGDKQNAAVTGTPQVFRLADWTVKRLFKPVGELAK